jgi:hypothetical protein
MIINVVYQYCTLSPFCEIASRMQHSCQNLPFPHLSREDEINCWYTIFCRFAYSVDPYGLVGQWLGDALNCSVYTYEVAPVFTIMEEYVLAELRHLIGFNEGDGIFCPGGSIANGYAINCARYNMFPSIKVRINPSRPVDDGPLLLKVYAYILFAPGKRFTRAPTTRVVHFERRSLLDQETGSVRRSRIGQRVFGED